MRISKLKFYLIYLLLIFFFNSKTVFSASFTFPSSLTTNTSDFVLLSETGTTPSVTGFSTDVLITIRATAGFVKITTVSGLEQINGYCGYTADSSSEPSNCADDNRSEIGFEGTQSEVNAALATLSFKGDGSTSSVSITASATPTGAAYNSTNGHYYRAVSSTDIRWDDARAAAKSEAQKFNGLTGYLVNITTAQENDFVANKVSVNAWTGGSDSGTERVWRWMDGPEADQTYTCQKFGTGGTGEESPINGVVCTEQSYLNWDFGEPNQYNGTNEDYMHVYGTGPRKGSWNDYVINNSNVDAYIIEYGGMGGTATVQGTATISITSTEASGTYTAFDDKELVGIVEGQSEGAKRFIYNSTNAVLERIEWHRTTKKNDNIKFDNVGISIDLEENTYPYAKLLDLYLLKGSIEKKQLISEKNINKFINELPLSNYLRNEFGLLPQEWKIWSSGYFKKGKIKARVNKKKEDYDSNALTIGMDKIIDENKLVGFALRKEYEDNDIGKSGSEIKSNSTSITAYSSTYKSHSFFIDGLVGYGRISNSLIRIEEANTSNSLTGKRDINQFFGSIKFNKLTNKNKFTSLLFGRGDFGFSFLEGFTESGNIQALKFEEQKLQHRSFSFGSLLKYKKKINRGHFLPYGRVEVFENFSPLSNVNAWYVSDLNTKYNHQIMENYDNSIKLEIGFDLNLIDSWYISASLRRLYRNTGNLENELAIKASKPF